jgi:hypothetical protein
LSHPTVHGDRALLHELPTSILAVVGLVTCIRWVGEYDAGLEAASTPELHALRWHYRYQAVDKWCMRYTTASVLPLSPLSSFKILLRRSECRHQLGFWRHLGLTHEGMCAVSGFLTSHTDGHSLLSYPAVGMGAPLIGRPFDIPQGCFQIILPPSFVSQFFLALRITYLTSSSWGTTSCPSGRCVAWEKSQSRFA